MRTRATRRGLALTELGLGAAQFGNLYRATSLAEVAGTMDAAWDAGIRLFDTAPHYGIGLSERRLGAELQKHPRDDFAISTKVGRLLEPSPELAGERDSDMFDVPADHVRVWDFSRDGILRSVEESLTRTGLDRFDILYLHDPDDHFEQACTEGIQTLIELREQGVVRAVGAGMNSAPYLTQLIERADVDIVMCAGRFTLLDSSAVADLLPLAHERGVGVVAAGIYNSGLLASPRPPANATYDYVQAPAELIGRAHRIADACEAHGVTLPDAAIAYVLRHPAVVSVVVGVRTPAQLAQTIDRYETDIPEALWRDLAEHHLIPESLA